MCKLSKEQILEALGEKTIEYGLDAFEYQTHKVDRWAILNDLGLEQKGTIFSQVERIQAIWDSFDARSLYVMECGSDLKGSFKLYANFSNGLSVLLEEINFGTRKYDAYSGYIEFEKRVKNHQERTNLEVIYC